MDLLAIYTIFLPLFGFLVASFFGKFFGEKLVSFLLSSFMVLSSIFAFIIFYQVIFNHQIFNVFLLPWIEVGDFLVDWNIRIDSLSAIMLVVVTSVSTLVHIYSIGYMKGDSAFSRFMSYLSLFTFFMLILVVANNLLQLFVGWEGVGLCSYLLIGFWYKKASACNAAMKAFIVNRVGDFAFILGLAGLFNLVGSISFDVIFTDISSYKDYYISVLGFDIHAISLICVLLFIGCMGKSAQIGLHVWLPDAMEGPTPVSALIHAATMVTAGVFLLARMSHLFEYSEFALSLITIVGAVTCIFAATIAITQNDIKRIIAYSTCSQLGYMFFACGVSAYSAGVFHLFTHAFFKALLFLGAGSVIHALSNIQDIRQMGGIWKKIPFTYVMMWIGSLALAGIPPFAGFYSKDVVLEAAFMSGTFVGKFAYIVGCLAAFLTALYSWRLLIVVFHGKNNSPKDAYHHIHESPLSMTIPLFLLALGSVFAGIVIYKFGIVDSAGTFWDKYMFISSDDKNILQDIHHIPLYAKYMPLLSGILGILLAFILYKLFPKIPAILAKRLSLIYKLSYNKYYIDELYNIIFIKPFKKISLTLWQVIDIKIIDNMGPNLAASLTKVIAGRFSKLQTGFIYNYAIVMIVSIVVIIAWFMYNFFLKF